MQRQGTNGDRGTRRRACPARVLRAALSGLVVASAGGCCSVSPPAFSGANLALTTPFLGSEDFAGSYVPAPGPVLNGLQSTYNGAVVVTMIDRTIVEKVLPNGMRLATPLAPSTTHPVVHLIGDQREPSTVAEGTVIPVPNAPGYAEMILLIPFVVSNSGTRWHSYVVRMYLDDFSAVAGGSAYGYAKVWSRLIKTETAGRMTHVVKERWSPTVFFESEVDSFPSSGPQTPALPPRWADMRTIIDMPILGSIGPAFVCSYWEWDLTNGSVTSASSKHQVVTKFRDGMEDWATMGPVANAIDGAVAMRSVRWRLGHPVGCQF